MSVPTRSAPDARPGRSEVLDLARSGRDALAARVQLRRADHVGSRVRLRGRAVVRNWGRMIVHERVQLVGDVHPIELVTAPGALLEVGARTYINQGTSIGASELVRIGADCLIGTHVLVMDSDFHRLEPERRQERPVPRPVVLEDNVWLGARVTVLPGVTMGAGSAAAAGAVVTCDVAPRTVVAGVPARVVRTLD